MKTKVVYNSRKLNYEDTFDFYPTPPWATRALLKHVIKPNGKIWECAAGDGHMVDVLLENNLDVIATDIKNGCDFLKTEPYKCDWIITNPPFKYGLEFARKSIEVADVGVAFLVKYTFLESKKKV